jgi:hypothetical protein
MRVALIAAIALYGLPLWKLRHRWRATVYRRDDWMINILPWFGHDIAALFSNRYFVTEAEQRMARQFRLYLAGYAALVSVFIALP